MFKLGWIKGNRCKNYKSNEVPFFKYSTNFHCHDERVLVSRFDILLSCPLQSRKHVFSFRLAFSIEWNFLQTDNNKMLLTFTFYNLLWLVFNLGNLIDDLKKNLHQTSSKPFNCKYKLKLKHAKSHHFRYEQIKDFF